MYIRRKNKIIKINSPDEAKGRKIYNTKLECLENLIAKQISQIKHTCKNDLIAKMANTYSLILKLPADKQKIFIRQMDRLGRMKYKGRGRELFKMNSARNPTDFRRGVEW